MWFVYILLCEDGSLYTGISTNPQKRLKAHKAGKGGAYTRSHTPIKIVFTEKCKDKSSALKREFAIKQLTKTEKGRLIQL